MPPAQLPIELLDRISQALPEPGAAYLVGGAVRDALLNRPVHDLDIVLAGQALKIGRQVAKALGADYFPLDPERETARLILTQPGGARFFIDFSIFRGPDLLSDLQERDFTINAMAIAFLPPYTLVDPLGGASDLRNKIMRLCNKSALQKDPLRSLRGVRQATEFGFLLLPETRQEIRQALPMLHNTSAERVRDELLRILECPQPALALSVLDRLGGLPYTFPELEALKGVTQSTPHVSEVWQHTLDVVKYFDHILKILNPDYDPDANANWIHGMVSVRLGRYRQPLHQHLNTRLNPDRSLHALLLLAALYHDSGKPQTRQVNDVGRIRFFDHEQLSEKFVQTCGKRLRLSSQEIERLQTIVRHHMRPLLLAQAKGMPTRRAVYRFFRKTGLAGVDICLLSLADTLATYGNQLPEETWIRQLDIVRQLLEAWWENNETQIAPEPLVKGGDLIQGFGLTPGPQIGQILEVIREAQAAGEIETKEQALSLARAWLEKQN